MEMQEAKELAQAPVIEPVPDPQLERELLAKGIDPVEQFYREQEENEQQ